MGDTYDDSGRTSVGRGVLHAPHLVVVLECDRPLAGGARYSLDGIDRVTIGRGDSTRVALREGGPIGTLDLRLPGRSLSAQHARLIRVGPDWAVEDLGSTNGVRVGGGRVSRHVLAPHEIFEVGHTQLRVNPSLPMATDAPSDLDCAGLSGDPLATLDWGLASNIEALAALASSDVPILILGESGTGKEIIAQWVHRCTGRRGPFVAVNCGAIPAALVESSLFGHLKGAFSGAVRDELGFVRSATGGTLFLDEIADLRIESQAALLRVLQEREVVAVGATRPVAVDLRLVAATHASIEKLVERGAFRQDLFARISGFTVRLPPLRERRDDIGILVASLLSRIAGDRASAITLQPEVGRAILSYEWPLNVRELEQTLATCVALAKDGRIAVAHLPSHIARVLEPRENVRQGSAGALSERDQRLRLDLLAQLERHAGNLADVARAMGKARMQVHRWCRRFGVDPNVYRR
jgi:sigma-54 dependent transcriptional regulator, acetoin dehydrogenase operon transcriptional activator AcoR